MSISLRVINCLICFLLIAPIFIVLIISFNGDPYLVFPPKVISTYWYEKFFQDTRWKASLINSLVIAFYASVLAVTVGFLAAYSLVRGRFKRKKLLLSFVLIPLIIPNIITAIALYYVSAPLNLIGSKPWIGVAHSVIAIPVVVLILLSVLQSIDVNIERAAYSLGASRFRTFIKVIFPMAAPGIFSAALFSFLISFDELIIALFLSGISAETLQVRIWNSLILDAEPIIGSVSGFLIIVTVLLLSLDAYFRNKRQKT